MTATDRELLELAAKAAGFQTHWLGGLLFIKVDNHYESWDALTDDGDALRLAVSLGLRLEADNAWRRSHAQQIPSTEWVTEPHEGDAFAATRRAIVRAAAEIARKLHPHRCQYCEDKLCGGTGIFTQFGQNRPCDGIPF